MIFLQGFGFIVIRHDESIILQLIGLAVQKANLLYVPNKVANFGITLHIKTDSISLGVNCPIFDGFDLKFNDPHN